jgi:hypothetical protein
LVHGAVGFTHQHRLTRRLWSWRDEFGTEGCWLLGLVQELMATGTDALSAMITAR